MQKESKKEKKIVLLSENDLMTAMNAGMFIVQVRFDNDPLNPVFVASDENLTMNECVAYVNEIGLFADKDYYGFFFEKKEIK